MIKRLLDIILVVPVIIILIPIFIVAAVSIKFASPGPVIYEAVRVGRNGHLFTMYKFRTMHVNNEYGAVITAANDKRIFKCGGVLRKLKIDELPQLFNILKGEMSFVGPRPEDPEIVLNCYNARQKETLKVLPGLASPGSIFVYTHGSIYLDHDDADAAYMQQLLYPKLEIDLYYVNNHSLVYDIQIICRTVLTIVMSMLGKRKFKYPKEFEKLIMVNIK